MMTINDYPEYLALGYLLNQNMLKYDDVVTDVEYHDDLQVVVVRTEHGTNFEQKLKKRTADLRLRAGHSVRRPAGGDGEIELPATQLRTSRLYQMTQAINTMPSLYLEAGAIQARAVQGGRPVCYMEDVGRAQRGRQDRRPDYRHGVDPATRFSIPPGG